MHNLSQQNSGDVKMGIFDKLFGKIGKSSDVKMAARMYLENLLGTHAKVCSVKFERTQYVEGANVWEVEGKVELELKIQPFGKQRRDFKCKINPDTRRVMNCEVSAT